MIHEMHRLQQEHEKRFGRRATFDVSTVGMAEAIERLRNAIDSGVPVPEEDPDAEHPEGIKTAASA